MWEVVRLSDLPLKALQALALVYLLAFLPSFHDYLSIQFLSPVTYTWEEQSFTW